MESEEILETYKEFMGSIIENDAKEKWIGLENFKEDSEDDFEYKELKRQVSRKYRVIEK